MPCLILIRVTQGYLKQRLVVLGCVFSEYALQNPNAWEFIRPILAENGGWAIFNFTPRGMNHAHKILQQAKEHNWFYQVLSVKDTNAIPSDILENEDRQMPGDLFRQEYMCEFIEGAGQFFRRVKENISYTPFVIGRDNQYILGVDLAKYQDFTVIAPLDLSTFTVAPLERFNQMDYNLQQAKIEAAHYRYNKGLIRIDSTGIGEPIYDNLAALGLRIEAYRFTEQSRNDLLTNLQIILEQDKIKIPN